MDDIDAPVPPGYALGEKADEALFARIEKLAFLVARSGKISLRAARESMEGPDSPGDAEVKALAGAVRLAEAMPPVPEVGFPRDLRGRGGFLDDRSRDDLRRLFPALDLHSRALLVAHFLLEARGSATARILGIQEGSIAVNLNSLLGRLREAAGGDSKKEGCGGAESDAVAALALGSAGKEEAERARAHVDTGCKACRSLHDALQAERELVRQALLPLLDADETTRTLLDADRALRREDAGGLLNPSRLLGISKSSCLAISLALGVVGALLLVLILELFWGNIGSFLFGEPEAPGPAGGTSPPPPVEPIRIPPKLTAEKALEDLAGGDPQSAAAARNFLVRNGGRNLDILVRARRERADVRAELDAILVRLGEEENRRQENRFRQSLNDLRKTAETQARQEALLLPKRKKDLYGAIASNEVETERLRAGGCPPEVLRRSEEELLRLKIHLGRLEGLSEEILVSTIELRLQGEVHARIRLAETRRRMITPTASIGLLGGGEPVFPWKESWYIQKSLSIPPLAQSAVPPETAAALLGAWVDFPVAVDPASLAAGAPPFMSMPQDPTDAESLVRRIASAAGLEISLSCGAVFLSAPGSPPPSNLLEHVAKFLTGGSDRSRFAAGYAFDEITWRQFGFDARSGPGHPKNIGARRNMIDWFEAARGTAVRDEETGRWGTPDEGY